MARRMKPANVVLTALAPNGFRLPTWSRRRLFQSAPAAVLVSGVLDRILANYQNIGKREAVPCPHASNSMPFFVHIPVLTLNHKHVLSRHMQCLRCEAHFDSTA